MERKELGLLIRAARKAEGLTQTQLAERIGTKKESISRIENGNISLGWDLLNKIATALNRRINPYLLIK